MHKLAEIVTVERLIEEGAVLKGKGFSPGIDRMTPEAAILWVQINGRRLLDDLVSGRYEPMPALGFTSAKKHGGFRQLSKCTAIDRMIQGCLFNDLTEQCETFFHPNSFAYRPGKGVGMALQLYTAYCMEYALAIRMDPLSCFDSISHEKLEMAVKSSLSIDRPYFDLIRKYIRQKVMIEREIVTREKGILQGSPLSSLLCNLYFNALDQKLSSQDIPFIRYADDIVIFGNHATELQENSGIIRDFLTNDLGLQINQSKYYNGPSADLVFLGHRFFRDRRGVIALRADESAEGAYYSWHDQEIRRTHRTLNILTDGILRQKDYSAVFDGEDCQTNIPLASIEMINIYSSVIFDTGFLKRALDEHVYINLFDQHGGLLGRFIPNTELKNPGIIYEQLQQYYDEDKRLYLVRQFLLASIHNTRLVIRYYQKQNPSCTYELTLAALDDSYQQIKRCCSYSTLLLLEAKARKEYYDCFDSIIKNEELVFENRSRRPSKNEINAMISFGNTVLYNIIANKINRSPLDIRIGYLHATTGLRKESLNLDIAEIFRPLIVDRTIFTLINQRSIGAGHFTREANEAVYLNETGKRIFLRKLYEKLDDTLQVKNRTVSYQMLIDEEIRLLVWDFRNGEKYKAYRQVR